MYLLSWIVLVSLSLGVSLWAFLWALRTGQFSDQARARYLPLRGEIPLSPVPKNRKRPVEVYFLLFIAVLGFLAMAAPILLSLLRAKG